MNLAVFIKLLKKNDKRLLQLYIKQLLNKQWSNGYLMFN